MADEKDLIPVVVQDVRNNNVLMLAYTNEEAMALTRETGYMHYWSRSRDAIWKKGETSGNVQRVIEILSDCDGDALLARVEQTGNACHTGAYSCFSKGPLPPSDIVGELWRVFEERRRSASDKSYTYRLLTDRNLLLKKIAEEGSEVIIAAKDDDRGQTVYEAADLLYHLLVLLFGEGIALDEVYKELEGRRR